MGRGNSGGSASVELCDLAPQPIDVVLLEFELILAKASPGERELLEPASQQANATGKSRLAYATETPRRRN